MAKRTRLRPKQIANVRKYYRLGYTMVDLAEHYGVHPSVISNIVHGRTHKRVADEAATAAELVKPADRALDAKKNQTIVKRMFG